MRGSPYIEGVNNWDIINSTYKAVIDTNDKTSVRLCKELGKSKVSSFSDLVFKLAECHTCVIYPGADELQPNLSYSKDIRFDYINKQIYYPVFTWKKLDISGLELSRKLGRYFNSHYGELSVPYEYQLKPWVVYEIQGNEFKCLVEYIDVYFITTGNKYRFLLNGLNYTNEVITQDDIKVLYNMYLSNIFKSSIFEFRSEVYKTISKKYLSNFEKDLYKQHKLRFYSKEYLDLNFRDYREYHAEDITKLTGVQINHGIDYKIRYMTFNKYLFDRLIFKKYWTGIEYKFDALGYLNYGQNGVVLILKKYWFEL